MLIFDFRFAGSPGSPRNFLASSVAPSSFTAAESSSVRSSGGTLPPSGVIHTLLSRPAIQAKTVMTYAYWWLSWTLSAKYSLSESRHPVSFSDSNATRARPTTSPTTTSSSSSSTGGLWSAPVRLIEAVWSACVRLISLVGTCAEQSDCFEVTPEVDPKVMGFPRYF